SALIQTPFRMYFLILPTDYRVMALPTETSVNFGERVYRTASNRHPKRLRRTLRNSRKCCFSSLGRPARISRVGRRDWAWTTGVGQAEFLGSSCHARDMPFNPHGFIRNRL